MAVSKASEPYAWPPRSTLTIYDGYDLPLMQSRDRMFDLADSLMMSWPHSQRTAYLGLSTLSAKWLEWDETTLSGIEDRIRYDLNFDGYRVSVSRMGGNGYPCDVEARWKLVIRART